VARAAGGNGLLRRPYLQRLLEDRTTILWTSPKQTSGSVVVIEGSGARTAFPATVTAFEPSVTQLPSTYYQYQADITGLNAGTNYQYQVLLDGEIVAGDPLENAFRTPAGGQMSFLVFGDSGAATPQQNALIQRMMAETGVAKVIHVGDLAYDSGTFAEFEANYFAANAGLMSRLPFFTTPGNHEYVTNNAAPFLAGHVAPASNVPAADLGRYYSYDWGDIHFASIDSNLLPGEASARMLSWLDNDLSATRKFWKIVFLHHPAYPTGTHRGDPVCGLVQQLVNPVVEKHGVQLVLAGHEHGYERSFPISANQPVAADSPSTMYVISGGGGQSMEEVGPLPQCALSVQAFHYLRVDVANSALTFRAIGMDGSVIDLVKLNPPPVIASASAMNVTDSNGDIEPNSVVSIFGQNFAPRAQMAPKLSHMTDQLGEITVSANGQPAHLLYVSPVQINLRIPNGVSGAVTLQVNTPNGSASALVSVSGVIRHSVAA
jgi:hypothetical protein